MIMTGEISWIRWSDADSQSILICYDDGAFYTSMLSHDPSFGSVISDWEAAGKSVEPYVVPQVPSEPTPEEKLAASGLTVDELKSLLGL